jgi:hypothetical protein
METAPMPEETTMETTTNIVTFDARPTDHAHRWRIDEPNGAMSRGRCRICGAQKEFRNWLAETDFITNSEYALAA